MDKGGDGNESAGREWLGDVVGAHRATGRAVGDVDEVGVVLHDIGESRAVGGEDRSQILVDLIGLRGDVARADEVALQIDSDLPGDIEERGVAGLDAHDLGIGADRIGGVVGVLVGLLHGAS
jgi:hypothetical protein